MSGTDKDDMKEEYTVDPLKVQHNPYAAARQQGYIVRIHHPDGTVEEREMPPKPEGTITLSPDVRAYFPDSEAVDKALRSLIALRELVPDNPKQ